MATDSAAQVRIQLRTKDSDIELPETGPILVSTGEYACFENTSCSWAADVPLRRREFAVSLEMASNGLR